MPEGQAASRTAPAIEMEYPYRPRWTVIILCALFFGACTAVLAHMAGTNQRGVIIEGIIKLGPGGATVFYWVLAGLSAGFVLLAGVLAWVRLTVRQRVAIAKHVLLTPCGRWSSAERAIAFAEIQELAFTAVGKQRFLKIIHKDGKFTLTSSLLPRNEDFDVVAAIIAERTATAESGPEKK